MAFVAAHYDLATYGLLYLYPDLRKYYDKHKKKKSSTEKMLPNMVSKSIRKEKMTWL
jgi:hypothetical protein